MPRFKFLIFGAGQRVVQDVLPCLRALKIQDSDVLVIRKKERKIDAYPRIEITTNTQSHKFKQFITNNRELVSIHCLPRERQSEFVNNLHDICNPKFALLDTPITSFNSVDFNDSKFRNTIFGVMEDSAIYPFSFDRKPNLILIKSALYEQHGFAFLRMALGEDFKMKVQLNRRLLFRILVTSNSRILWFGRRNYSQGTIKGIQLKNNGESGPGFSDLRINFENPTYWRELSSKLGNEHIDFTSEYIKKMKDFKRINLLFGLEQLIKHGKMVFPNLDLAKSMELLLARRLRIK